MSVFGDQNTKLSSRHSSTAQFCHNCMERRPDMTEDVNYVDAHEQVVKCEITACLYSSTDLSIEHIQCTEYVINALL